MTRGTVSYIGQRLILIAVTTVLVSSIVFLLLHQIPGSAFLNETRTSPEALAANLHHYGLDLPLPQQYLNWFAGVLHGDLGESLKNRGVFITPLLVREASVSATVGFYALIVTIGLGLILGIIAALRQNTWVDYFVRVMKEYRRVLLTHPNLVGLMAHLRLASLISDTTFEHGAAAMAESGIPRELMLTITEAAEALVFGWVYAKLADRELSDVTAEGPARRELAQTNALDEDRRFELACYALTNGFLASVMLRGPQSWQGGKGARKATARRRPG